MSFYEDNKGYLDKYWDDELNNTSKESLKGNENGVFYFKCKKCGKSWSISSLSLLYSYGECNCEDRNLLRKYWDTEKNNEIGLSVEDIPLRSGKKIFLKCPECHGEWNDYDVADVTYRKKSCPYCSGKRVLSGVNDLLSCYPEVVEKYWDWEKNSVEPSSLYKNTSKKAFWKCSECGYSWESPVSRLTRDGQGCPCCAGKKVKEGYNDFLYQYPEIVAKYWDYNRNKIKPSEITSGSNKKIYCKCPNCGGEWEDTPKILKDRKVCPVCWGKTNFPTRKDDNNLQEDKGTFGNLYPELVDLYWDWDKNNEIGLNPFEMDLQSNKKVFLKCKDCGNSWSNWTVSSLINYKDKCPYCSNSKLIEGTNDILSKSPIFISKYWDFDKNTVKPNKVKFNSGRLVKLKCDKCNHRWEMTVKELYDGKGCPVCEDNYLERGINDFKSCNNVPTVHISNKEGINEEDILKSSNKKLLFKCDVCGNEWYSYPYTKTGNNSAGCPVCAKESLPTKSKQEKQIYEFLREHYNGIIETSKVGLLPNNMELDIYIPKKKIGIEFNGIYWHSEIYKKKDRHYLKHKYCEERGIKLFQIWEDQWRDKKEIVKRLLLSKIGVLNQVKVNARDCSIKEVSKKEAESFMNENHIQGFTVASVYLDLVSEDWGIVAICQFLKTGKEGIYNLNRYATSCNVRGGFTKLIKNFERKYHPKKIITFSDNDYSDGGLYRNNGFILEEELKPDYYYTTNCFNKRYHKFNYRKERFYNDSHLTYMPDLTERELADLNKIFRVWDSGKIRWIKVYK